MGVMAGDRPLLTALWDFSTPCEHMLEKTDTWAIRECDNQLWQDILDSQREKFLYLEIETQA